MAHAESQVTIERTPDEVLAFLADGLNNSKWRDGVISIELKSGSPAASGAEYKQVLKGPGGRPIAGDYKITSLEPGKQMSFAVSEGPARPTGQYLLVADGNGTKLTFSLDYEPKGLKKLLNPMIQKTMQSEVAALDRLKQVLEAS